MQLLRHVAQRLPQSRFVLNSLLESPLFQTKTLAEFILSAERQISIALLLFGSFTTLRVGSWRRLFFLFVTNGPLVRLENEASLLLLDFLSAF